MDDKLQSRQKAQESKLGGAHEHSPAEVATKRLLDESLTKFHVVNGGGRHIESVKETKGGYDVTVARGSQYESVKIGRDQVGSALTLDLLGPDLYKSVHNPDAIGQRTLTMVGGPMKGVYDAAAKEWSHNPSKAIADGVTGLAAAAALTVAAEAAPVLATIMGASAIGVGCAEAVVHYPDFAKKTGRLNQVWNQAGHVDGNMSIAQAKEVGGLVGDDAFHLGTATLTTVLGCKGGLKLRPEVSGNLEAAAVTAAAQFGKSLLNALSDMPKTLEGAFNPSGLKLAFATAVADVRVPFEKPTQPGILKMGAHDASAREGSTYSAATGEQASAKGAATQIVAKMDEASLAAIRQAETPQQAFGAEEGWRQVKAKSVLGPVYKREFESLVNGEKGFTVEHFVPHKLLAITYKSSSQDYEVVFDLARGVETTTDNLARTLLGQPATRLKLDVQELPPPTPVAPATELPGDGKVLPNSKWLPSHPKR